VPRSNAGADQVVGHGPHHFLTIERAMRQADPFKVWQFLVPLDMADEARRLDRHDADVSVRQAPSRGWFRFRAAQ